MLKNRKMLICMLLVVFALAILAGGCGSAQDKPKEEPAPSEEKATINFFFYKETIVDAMDKMARAFMDENPNVTIINEMIGPEYNTVLKTKDAAGKLPEIWAASSPGEKALKPYIESGKIVDVSHFKVLKNLPQDFLDSITFSDGKIYLVPLTTNARGIIYNKELFEKAGITETPNTLDEMKEACEKLKAIGVIPFAAGGKDGWTLGSNILQPGQQIFADPDWPARRDKGEASWKDFMEVFDFIDLYKANVQPRPLDADYMDQITLFATEEAAMIIQGPWGLDTALSINPEIGDKAGIFPIPFTNDPNMNKLYTGADQYFVVSSHANIEMVDKYFDFMINGKGNPIFSNDVAEINPYGIDFAGNSVHKAILEYISKGFFIGDDQYNASPDGWWQANANAMQQYMGGQVTREQMMEMLDKEWDTLTGN